LRDLLGADEAHAFFLRRLAAGHRTIIHRLSAIARLLQPNDKKRMGSQNFLMKMPRLQDATSADGRK